MAYVYSHTRLDTGEVFYIGISSKDDADYTRAHVKSGRNDLWNNVVSECEFSVNIIFENVSIEFAKEKERELIAKFGLVSSNGCLTNVKPFDNRSFSDTGKSPSCIIAIKIPLGIKQQALELAKEDGRTFSNLVNFALLEYFKNTINE